MITGGVPRSSRTLTQVVLHSPVAGEVEIMLKATPAGFLSGLPEKLLIPAGAAGQVVDFRIEFARNAGKSEDVVLELLARGPGTGIGKISRQTLHLSYNPPARISLSIDGKSNLLRAVGQNRTKLVATLEKPANRPIDLAFHTRGSAEGGVDYVRLNDVITIPPGAKRAEVEIVAMESSEPRGNRSLSLTCDNPPEGVELQSRDVSVFIGDLVRQVSLFLDKRILVRGIDPHATLSARLDGSSPAGRPIVIRYEVAGSANPGIDYQPLSHSLSIAEGQTEGSLSIDAMVSGNDSARRAGLAPSRPREATRMVRPFAAASHSRLGMAYRATFAGDRSATSPGSGLFGDSSGIDPRRTGPAADKAVGSHVRIGGHK